MLFKVPFLVGSQCRERGMALKRATETSRAKESSLKRKHRFLWVQPRTRCYGRQEPPGFPPSSVDREGRRACELIPPVVRSGYGVCLPASILHAVAFSWMTLFTFLSASSILIWLSKSSSHPPLVPGNFT